jgi:hypothetical protein
MGGGLYETAGAAGLPSAGPAWSGPALAQWTPAAFALVIIDLPHLGESRGAAVREGTRHGSDARERPATAPLRLGWDTTVTEEDSGSNPTNETLYDTAVSLASIPPVPIHMRQGADRAPTMHCLGWTEVGPASDVQDVWMK